MERKYLVDLENWLKNTRRKPLMVWGARQVGKTYLIKDIFAERFFPKKYIYVDCRTNQEFTDFCEKNVNAEKILNYLSLNNGVVIDKNVLLIFDEVQECLPIVTLMKYFCQDFPEIPIIETGSMVRIKIQRENRKRGLGNKNRFLFPVGKINQLTIYPMDFEEYLLNKNKVLFQSIKNSYAKGIPSSKEEHSKGLEEFFNYLLVGGMPEAVDAYLETGNYQESREVLKDLYDNYLSDMDLYQASPEAIVRSKKVFQTIYNQLNKESKNFKSTLIEKGAKGRAMESPIDWLILSNLVVKSSLVKEKVTIPLINSDESLFRLYLSDIGMFSYQSGVNGTTFLDNKTRNTLSGIFFENYVANELTSHGIPLFYWKGKGSSEFEFIIETKSSIIPIDVKKNKGPLNSLERFKDHNSLALAIKISQNNFGFDSKTKVLTIPFYDVFMLCEDISKGEINCVKNIL